MKKEKWTTLEHHGPYFSEPHKIRGWKIKVQGSDLTFVSNPLADEMTYHWAAKLATDYVKDSVFQKNFWKDYEPAIRESHDFADSVKFPEDFDFTEYHERILEEREAKKNRSKEEKKAEKEEREERKAHYGWAKIDGKDTFLGNYAVEPAGIFMGRGKHPLRGRWKPQIFPGDITLNLSKGSSVPSPPEGHEWKAIVENKNALWTAMWYEKLTGAQKRILFAATSFVRQSADQKKFVKAIELANNFDKVNEFIEKKLSSRDFRTRELATVCHLISKLSIRVGDEKGEDTADTVGASSLRYEHVKVENTSVVFDFLGKDSVRYYNKVEDLDINAVRNIKDFLKDKKKGDKLFPHVNSKEIKDFLSLVIDGLTAKQFRTATGSTLLSAELKKQNIKKDLKESKKVEYFTEANLDVAIQLNHQSAVSEAYDRSLNNMKEKLKLYKEQLKALKEESKSEITAAKEARDSRINFAKNRYKGDKLKESTRRARETFDKKQATIEKRIERLAERVDNLKSKIRIKEKTKGIALGTSKLNYADPRIPISWAKDNGVDIKRIYPKTAQEKFSWAFDVDSDFYKKYPKV